MIQIKERESKSIEGLKSQGRIGWNNFCRDRISKTLIKTMSQYYSTTVQKNFTGIGWSKRIIALMIDTHVK